MQDGGRASTPPPVRLCQTEGTILEWHVSEEGRATRSRPIETIVEISTDNGFDVVAGPSFQAAGGPSRDPDPRRGEDGHRRPG